MIKPRTKFPVINREAYFDTAMKISIHPIGASHIIFGLAIIMKNKNPCMLEVAVNDSMHRNIFALPFYTGGKTANTPDDHLHFYTGIAGFIELADHFFFL